jgi:hypothetical protein
MKSLLFGFVMMSCMFNAMAQVLPSNSLGQCVADSTTGKDRKDLVRWVVAAMMKHPAMADLNSISAEQSQALSKTAATLYERLLTKDCVMEVKKAYKSGGATAIKTGFEYLGRVAMQELVTDPNVAQFMASLIANVDSKKLQKLLEED